MEHPLNWIYRHAVAGPGRSWPFPSVPGDKHIARRAIRLLVIAVAFAGFACTGARAYSDVVITNTTEYTISGTVDYAGPGFICEDDDYSIPPKKSEKDPAPTWSHSRGACLIIGISGNIAGPSKYGEKLNVVSYDSTGTGYADFIVAPYGGSYRIFSTTEYSKVTDTRQGKSPGFYFVNETDWPVAYSLDQVGCLYHGIVPAGTDGRPGVMKVDTGAVWFTMRAHIQPDGQNPQSDWDCVEPVAQLVGDVAMAALSGGSSAAAQMGGKIIIKTVAKAAIKEALKKTAKKVITKLIKDIAKEELGRLFTESTSIELYGQYAGYEWPFRCDNMPEYHITGGPKVLKDETGEIYLEDGPIFTVTKTNTCGDDMMLASRKSQSAGRSFFASYDNPAAVATGNAGAGGAATLWKAGDIAEVRTPRDTTWRIATVQQFHPTDGILILYSDTGERNWMPEKFMRPAPPGTVVSGAGGAASQWKAGDVVEVQRPADGRWTVSSVLNLDPISGVFIRYQDTGEQMWVPQTIVRAPQQAAPGSWKVGDVVEVQRPADGRWTPSNVLNLDPISGVFIRYQDTGEQMWVPQTIVRSVQTANIAPGAQPAPVQPANPHEVACQTRGQIAAGAGTQETRINFANAGTGDMLIYWINGAGQETDYQSQPQPLAVIPPGQSQTIAAYVGHSFVIKDAAQACLSVYQAVVGQNDVAFGPSAPGNGSQIATLGNTPVQTSSQTGAQAPSAHPIDPQESAFDRDLSQRIAALLFDRCGERGTVQSSNPAEDNGTRLQLSNVGTRDLRIFWIDVVGAETGQGNGEPYVVLPPGTTTGSDPSIPHQYYIALDDQSNCVGIGDTGFGALNHLAFSADLASSGASAQQKGAPVPDPAVSGSPGAATCSQRGRIVSAGGSEVTTVDFTNTGNGDLSVYWIDGQGEEKDYAGGDVPLAVVAPGATQNIQAYVGHAFIARDAQSVCLGIAQIAPGHNAFSYAAAGSQTATAPGGGTDPNVGADPAQPGPAAGIPQPATCNDRGRIVSAGGSEVTTVDFTNTGNGDLSVYWIDGQGEEKDYAGALKPLAVIAPGATQSLQAYVGHAFIAVDADETCLGVAQISPGHNRFAYATPGAQTTSQGSGPTAAPAPTPDGVNSVLGCEFRGTIGSNGGGELASLTFQNTGDGDLHVFWIDADGRETNGQGAGAPLAIVGPGQTASLQAYLGHAYLATDASGNCLGIVQVLQPANDFAFAAHGGFAAAANGNGQDAPAENAYAETGTEQPQTGYADPAPAQADSSSGYQQAAGGCELRGQIASTGSEAASIDIANVGTGAIAVYWINGQGVEGDYQNAPQPLIVIEPGASQSIGAYIGFAYTVADAYGNCLGVAQVTQATNAFGFAGVQ